MKRIFQYILIFTTVILVLTNCNNGRKRDRANSSRNKYQTSQSIRNERGSKQRQENRSRTVVKMNHSNGVYHVPCKINGVEMNFIFDTGASDITISSAEAIFLMKQGKISEEDVVGTQHYQVADGSIHEGTIIVLKNVEIGGRTLTNVKASVMNNIEAPLLLGQSALSRFGKISIDYNKKEIIFE